MTWTVFACDDVATVDPTKTITSASHTIRDIIYGEKHTRYVYDDSQLIFAAPSFPTRNRHLGLTQCRRSALQSRGPGSENSVLLVRLTIHSQSGRALSLANNYLESPEHNRNPEQQGLRFANATLQCIGPLASVDDEEGPAMNMWLVVLPLLWFGLSHLPRTASSIYNAAVAAAPAESTTNSAPGAPPAPADAGDKPATATTTPDSKHQGDARSAASPVDCASARLSSSSSHSQPTRRA
ncbi:hypothetical protein FRC09_006758 [Ceratobasidium sp. 395]|nr:hypothetical protein FRC09_006758 [Ceratobasidium sp. 395]